VNSSLSTCDRLLDSAERLFAEDGFHMTSLRQITQDAGTNLAAVNYHFGSKQALIVAVFRRRLDALNQARLSRLDQALAGADEPALEAVLDAFVRPALALTHDEAGEGHRFMRILLRAFADQDEQLHRDLSAEYAHVMRRFADAIEQALPGASRDNIRRQLDFIVGALTHTMAESHHTDGPAIASDLVTFAAAGLRGTRSTATASIPPSTAGAKRTMEIVR
jgi:AcrR family transcriptional regulator